MSGDDDLNVDAAYALETPEDNKKLYAAWAATYDSDFAEAKDYLFPGHVAAVFASLGGEGPVLDVGAGTGLVAQEIEKLKNVEIDAIDLSNEMLAVAREKNLYRHLMQGDLTQDLLIETATYAAIVSAGTFTHGHVGPQELDELMRIAAPGALFVLSNKSDVHETHGFKAKFESLSGDITGFEVKEFPIYGPGADAAHADDIGLVISFCKL